MRSNGHLDWTIALVSHLIFTKRYGAQSTPIAIVLNVDACKFFFLHWHARAHPFAVIANFHKWWQLHSKTKIKIAIPEKLYTLNRKCVPQFNLVLLLLLSLFIRFMKHAAVVFVLFCFIQNSLVFAFADDC